MLNIIRSEFLKLKKDAMFFTGIMISLIIPVLLIIKDSCFSDPPSGITEWMSSCFIVDFMVLSAMSGFVITNLIQKEYQAGTMKNILSSSVSRVTFIFSKLIIWFLWYLTMLVSIEAITILGARLLYAVQFNSEFVALTLKMFSRFGLLSFVSFFPLLWITVLQQKLFYPSVLAALCLTGILVGGINISTEMILPASFMPWTAVSLVALFQVEGPYNEIGWIVIIATGLCGLFLSCYAFNKQDQ